MITLTREAFDAYLWAVRKGIIDSEVETIDDIIEIVTSQEIVTYASVKGQVSFDVGDLVEREV
jgi:hypothetical protein